MLFAETLLKMYLHDFFSAKACTNVSINKIVIRHFEIFLIIKLWFVFLFQFWECCHRSIYKWSRRVNLVRAVQKAWKEKTGAMVTVAQWHLRVMRAAKVRRSFLRVEEPDGETQCPTFLVNMSIRGLRICRLVLKLLPPTPNTVRKLHFSFMNLPNLIKNLYANFEPRYIFKSSVHFRND